MEKDLRKFDVIATLAAVGALLCWCIGPNVIKYLSTHLDLWTQNMLRYFAACLFWMPFLLLDIRKKRFDKTIWRRALIPTAANIIMQSLWACAFYYINPAFMLLLAKSSIIWIAGFSIIFFSEERPLIKSKRFWLGLSLSLCGVLGVLFSREDFAAAGSIKGVVIALLTAFFWAAYTITAKIAFKNTDARAGFSVVTIYTLIGLSILAFIFGNPSGTLNLTFWPWFWIIISGIISISFAHVLYYTALNRVGATIPSLILLAQPFLVLGISGVVFAERLNNTQWFFGIVLITGSAIAIWAQQHLKAK